MQTQTEVGVVKLKSAKSKSGSKSMNESIREIKNVDLDMIKFKLSDQRDQTKWSKKFANEMEKEYRRFLILRLKYPEHPIAPCVGVDTFWHQHILDTQKYMEDCERIFGFYLHHYPYSGLLGDEDEKLATESFNFTHVLYEREFGEKPWEVKEMIRARRALKRKAASKTARKKKKAA